MGMPPAASDGVEVTLHLKYLSVSDVAPSFCSRHVGFALGKVKASDRGALVEGHQLERTDFLSPKGQVCNRE